MLAIATEVLLLPLGGDLEQQLGAALVQLHVAELVKAEELDAAVAGDGPGQLQDARRAVCHGDRLARE